MFQRNLRRSRHGLIASIAAAALLLAAVVPAYAADSTGEGYRDQAGQVQEQVSGVGSSRNGNGGGGDGNTGPTTTSGNDDGTLPFTGLDTALILMTGLVLAGLGLGLRRVSRQTV